MPWLANQPATGLLRGGDITHAVVGDATRPQPMSSVSRRRSIGMNMFPTDPGATVR
jgi:hypothetical protein